MIVSRFVVRGRSASGVVTVQVVEKHGSRVVSRTHVGSAHSDADLAVLLEQAERLLHPGQEAFDLGELSRSASTGSVSDWTQPTRTLDSAGDAGSRGRPRSNTQSSGVVVGQPAKILWDVPARSYERLGFDALGDDVFKKIVLARIVEPTSKIDSLRVLARLGIPAPATEKTVYRMLQRVSANQYREKLARACFIHASESDALKLVMYDATT
jgi:hypothetical protein